MARTLEMGPADAASNVSLGYAVQIVFVISEISIRTGGPRLKYPSVS